MKNLYIFDGHEYVIESTFSGWQINDTNGESIGKIELSSCGEYAIMETSCGAAQSTHMGEWGHDQQAMLADAVGCLVSMTY